MNRNHEWLFTHFLKKKKHTYLLRLGKVMILKRRAVDLIIGNTVPDHHVIPAVKVGGMHTTVKEKVTKTVLEV